MSVGAPGPAAAAAAPAPAQGTAPAAPAAGVTPDPAAPPAPPAPTASRQFPALAAKEKALQRKREELQRQQSTFAQQQREFETQRAELERLRAKPANAREALDRYGYTYDQLTQEMLTADTPEALVRATNERLDQFEARQAQAAEKAANDAKVAAERHAEEVIGTFKQEIASFGEQNKEKFEAVALFGAHELVYDTIDYYFEQTKAQDAQSRGVPLEQGVGRVLTIAEAYDEVEKHLREHAKGLSGAKFLKASDPTPPAAGANGATPAPKSDQGSAQRRTVNNGLTPSTPTLVPSHGEEDRMSRAMRALAGS